MRDMQTYHQPDSQGLIECCWVSERYIRRPLLVIASCEFPLCHLTELSSMEYMHRVALSTTFLSSAHQLPSRAHSNETDKDRSNNAPTDPHSFPSRVNLGAERDHPTVSFARDTFLDSLDINNAVLSIRAQSTYHESG